MSCKVRFWKSQGTQSSPNPTTPAAKELQTQLAALQAERAALDSMWTTPIERPIQQQTQQTQQSSAFFQSSKKNETHTYQTQTEQRYATWG